MIFRRIVSQPNIEYTEKKKLRRIKSDSNLVKKPAIIPKTLKYNQKKLIVHIKNNSTGIAHGIQDFEFANEILHSNNTFHSLFMMSLLLYTIECDKQKQKRLYFIFTCMIMMKIMNI